MLPAPPVVSARYALLSLRGPRLGFLGHAYFSGKEWDLSCFPHH